MVKSNPYIKCTYQIKKKESVINGRALGFRVGYFCDEILFYRKSKFPGYVFKCMKKQCLQRKPSDKNDAFA